MKKLLSLFLLLTPLISVCMEKGGQPATKGAPRKAAPTPLLKDDAEILALTRASMSESVQNLSTEDKKEVHFGSEERAAFIACLNDMRYYHLQNPELKETYKTVVKLAQMEYETLKNLSGNKAEYVQWPTGGEALHRAQMQLAATINLVCPSEDFSAHVKTVCGLVAKKHGSSNGKDVAVDMESFAVFNEILTNYDTLTGTSFKDMATRADEKLALRLAGKIAAMKKTDKALEKK